MICSAAMDVSLRARADTPANTLSSSRNPLRHTHESPASSRHSVASRSVQRRGSFIEEPSCRRTVTVRLPPQNNNSSFCPQSGWWRRTTVVVEVGSERQYLVCDNLPMSQSSAAQVRIKLIAYESRQYSITFAKMREECVGVLLDNSIQQRFLGSMTRITLERRCECGAAMRFCVRSGSKHPTDWNASMPLAQCALGSLWRCLYPFTCQSQSELFKAEGPQALLVHHGNFWKGDRPQITGMLRSRLKLLLAHEINLIAYHLPLDAQPEFGNNVAQMTEEQFADHVGDSLGREPMHFTAGNTPIKRVAWCTGQPRVLSSVQWNRE